MFRRTIMSASSGIKDGKLIANTVFSSKNMTNGNTGTKARIRALQSKSSPVYKTQSETSLVSGFRNLSIREAAKQTITPPARRGFCTGNSGRINVRSLQDVAKIFKDNKVENVVVVAGAGISTPSGIPDFRTPGTGLYDNLQQYQIPYPEAIFDIDYFHRNPKPFFTLAKELFPSLGKYRPNYIHYFVRLLYEKGLLLRMYTQNIDGLERLAGIPPSKLVEAHGTFATATCVLCGHKCDGDELKDRILEDKLPKCKKTSCPGMVKPDIVFFGEDLPRKFYYHFKDMLQADVVIVMGTSLEVQPFAGIIDSVRWQVPRILFNRDVVGPFLHHRRTKDVVAEGDILETMQKFITMIGWSDDMKELITTSEGGYNIGLSPSPVAAKNAINESKSVIKTVIKDPFVNAIWRQNASYNLKDYCSESSSDTESSSSSDSSSSEDIKLKPVRKLRDRFHSNNKLEASRKPSSKTVTKNYSTSAKNIRSLRSVTQPVGTATNVYQKPPHVPVIKTKPFGSAVTHGNPSIIRRQQNITHSRGTIMQTKLNQVKPPPATTNNTNSRIYLLSNSNRATRNISPGFRLPARDKTADTTRPSRTTVTSVQVYKALRHRSESADLPRLRMQEKLTRRVAESSSSESVSGSGS